MNTPRLRLFAGPNGSGKSTIKEVLSDELLGIYINPDEIEKEILKLGFLDFSQFGIDVNRDEVLVFFKNSTLLKKAKLLEKVKLITFNENKLGFLNISINSYYASVCADFIRKQLLINKQSFTFESVMSSYDKVELLKLAQASGYRTYLYFVATSDPIINISRVKNRVLLGGHNVPKDKIISRYYRALENLKDAIEYSHRAYIFDNSTHSRTFLAEITNAKKIEIKTDTVPVWFEKYLLVYFKENENE